MNEQEEINKLLMEAGAFGVTSDSPTDTGESEPVDDKSKIEETDGNEGADPKGSNQGEENGQDGQDGDNSDNGSDESKDGKDGKGVNTETGKKHEEAVPYDRFEKVNTSYIATKEENSELKKQIENASKERKDVIDGFIELLKINDLDVKTFEDIEPFIKDKPELMEKLKKAFSDTKENNQQPTQVYIDDTNAGSQLFLELFEVGFIKENNKESILEFGNEVINRFGGKVKDARDFYGKIIDSLKKAKEQGKAEYSNELKKKTLGNKVPVPGIDKLPFTEKKPDIKDFSNRKDFQDALDEYEIRKELSKFS